VSEEIEVKNAECMDVSSELEWFIPLINTDEIGLYWYAGQMERTRQAAEDSVRYSGLKYGCVARVILPCKNKEMGRG